MIHTCQIESAGGNRRTATLDFTTVAPYRLQASIPELGEFDTHQRDLFDALIALREWLAARDAMILVQGAARQVYPSGMLREAGGRMAYRLDPGQPARRNSITDIFAPAERTEIASVAAQRAFFEEWLQSLGS